LNRILEVIRIMAADDADIGGQKNIVAGFAQ
jgi:hypothetical protein